MPANSEPQPLTVKGENKDLMLENILVGDVWVLGGQSNMEHPLSRVENGQLEIVSANFDNIRILTVPAADGPEERPGFETLFKYFSDNPDDKRMVKVYSKSKRRWFANTKPETPNEFYLLNEFSKKYNYKHLYLKYKGKYLKLKKIDNAIDNYNLATKYNPNYLAAYRSKVDLYYNLKNYEQALIEIENVLKLDPSNDKIYHKRGDIFAEKNQLDLALRNYENAYTLNPDKAFLLGSIQITKNKMCYWSDFFQLKKEVENKILDKKKISPPYTVTTIYDSPKLQLECSKIWQNEYKFENKINFKFNKRFSKKIKIGFFSADFRTHAMGHLMVRMMELHNKDDFEIYGFYFGPKIKPDDEISKRILKCFDKFVDIS